MAPKRKIGPTTPRLNLCALVGYIGLSDGAPAALGHSENLEAVVDTDTRQIIQHSMDIRRNKVLLVYGLSANDTGDLPALAIGEAQVRHMENTRCQLDGRWRRRTYSAGDT